jgi:hypothetical protein
MWVNMRRIKQWEVTSSARAWLCTEREYYTYKYISYWKNYNVTCNQHATYNKIIYTYKTQPISDAAVCKLYL